MFIQGKSGLFTEKHGLFMFPGSQALAMIKCSI